MGYGIELMILAGDAAIAGILYEMIKINQSKINLIENAPVVNIDKKLASTVASQLNQEMPFVCIEGVVHTDREPLKSRFTDMTGVIQTSKMYELKSKRMQGYWHDSEYLIQDNVSTIPFFISKINDKIHNKTCRIVINDPLASEYILDSLHVTYDKFDQNASGAISRGIDRIFGDVTKGFKHTETMLPIGSSLLGMGRLVLEKGQLMLKTPNINAPYIVTLLNRSDIIRSIRKESTIYKIMFATCSVIGAGFLYAILKHAYSQFLTWKRNRTATEFYRQQRERHIGDDTRDIQTLCVICMTNERRVVLLDCGHICMCQECAEELGDPLTCPICRAPVARMLPTYVP